MYSCAALAQPYLADRQTRGSACTHVLVRQLVEPLRIVKVFMLRFAMEI